MIECTTIKMKTFLFVAFVFFTAESCAQQIGCGEKGFLDSGVSDEDIIEIVNRHNRLRLRAANGQVEGQPKASNMKRLVWDDEIALQAQNLTNTCVFNHVIAFDRRWKWVGQNLFLQTTGSDTNVNYTQAIDFWFSENQYFTYPNITVPGRKTGHYTQIVWAETRTVGCGYTKYYDDTAKYYRNYVVCNYGPGGNYVGAAPYKIGPGCENLC